MESRTNRFFTNKSLSLLRTSSNKPTPVICYSFVSPIWRLSTSSGLASLTIPFFSLTGVKWTSGLIILVCISLISFLASSSHWGATCFYAIKSFWFFCYLLTSTVAEIRVSTTSPILGKKLRSLYPLPGWTIDLLTMSFSWVFWLMLLVSNLVSCYASEETRFYYYFVSSFISLSSLWSLASPCSLPSISPSFSWIWFASFYSSCLTTGTWTGCFSGPTAGGF